MKNPAARHIYNKTRQITIAPQSDRSLSLQHHMEWLYCGSTMAFRWFPTFVSCEVCIHSYLKGFFFFLSFTLTCCSYKILCRPERVRHYTTFSTLKCCSTQKGSHSVRKSYKFFYSHSRRSLQRGEFLKPRNNSLWFNRGQKVSSTLPFP